MRPRQGLFRSAETRFSSCRELLTSVTGNFANRRTLQQTPRCAQPIQSSGSADCQVYSGSYSLVGRRYTESPIIYNHIVLEQKSQSPLSVAVRDFGPIRRATVELRPLTVFVGQSNTGKSCMARLIYALHNLFRTTSDQGSPQRSATQGLSGSLEGLPLVPQRKRNKTSPEEVRTLMGWIASVVEDRQRLRDELPDSIVNIIRPFFELENQARSSIENEIMRCIGQDNMKDLIRFGARDGASIEINKVRSRNTENADLFTCSIHLKARETEVNSSMPIGAQLRIEDDESSKHLQLAWNVIETSERVNLFHAQSEEHRNAKRILDHYISSYICTLTRSTLPIVVGPLHTSAYYLPADRAGITHAHRAIVGALVGGAPTAGFRTAINLPPLSGTLTDFLQELISLKSDPRGPRRPEDNLGKQIEDKVLRGSVMVERNDAYPFLSYRPDGARKNIPLASSSSMVSELAPIVLYLKFIVQRGDVLIIEEPEAHLHPEMQSTLACEISRLVKSGVRVLITTHSELILEQLGNLIRASNLPRASRIDIADSDSVLDPDVVGVWLFTYEAEEQGSIVEEAVLDSDSGLFRVGYGAVREMLYNQSARTFNRLQTMG